MTRLFGRGELKLALLHVVAELGPTNGYAIMQGLAQRVGGRWHPSPGAIYPALLALEDARLLAGREVDGVRRYELTAAGRRQVDADPTVLEAVAGRARDAPAPAVTVGAVLDRLVATAPVRDRRISAEGESQIEAMFTPLLAELRTLTAEEAP
jgi:DNA-binding PadR family transcriptional regulator